MIADMTLSHEAKMSEVPDSYKWSAKPIRDGLGLPPKGWTALTAWGQLYREAGVPIMPNTRVQFKDFSTYLLSKSSNRWTRVQYSINVSGAAYVEDFVGDKSIAPDLRTEADGSTSVKLVKAYNFHFWPANDRAKIDPNDVAGVLTTFKARLILDDPAKADDRSKARYLAGSGGDCWESSTAVWDNWMTNGGLGVGRMKRVNNQWSSYNFHTRDPEDLRKNPPPL
jgi:hypothetical protein